MRSWRSWRLKGNNDRPPAIRLREAEGPHIAETMPHKSDQGINLEGILSRRGASLELHQMQERADGASIFSGGEMIIKFRHDPLILGPHFGEYSPDSSFARWDTVSKVVFGLGSSLEDHELAFFREHTGWENPPQEPIKEFYGIIGRRGGKSINIASWAAYLAVVPDYSHVLKPGETGYIGLICPDRDQGRVPLSYLRAMFTGSPILQKEVEDILNTEIRLKKGISIQILTAANASIRGRTLICAIFDEAAFLKNSEGMDNGIEIKRAVLPALATTDGPLIVISSPYSRQGLVWEAHRRYYGKEGRVMVLVAPSRVMNPALPAEIVEQALAEDYESAKAEYLAQFREDVSGFLDSETIDSAVIPRRRELPPQPNFRHFAFTDPSGGRQDSFTLGIAHRDEKNKKVILDVIRRRVPPFNPADVVAEFSKVLREYRCREVVGDRYSAEWVVSAFRENSIWYRNSERDRSQIFAEALPLFTRGEVELLDDKVLLAELRSLERRTRAAGREFISHNPGGHDDSANSACGALVLAQMRPRHVTTSHHFIM